MTPQPRCDRSCSRHFLPYFPPIPSEGPKMVDAASAMVDTAFVCGLVQCSPVGISIVPLSYIQRLVTADTGSTTTGNHSKYDQIFVGKNGGIYGFLCLPQVLFTMVPRKYYQVPGINNFCCRSQVPPTTAVYTDFIVARDVQAWFAVSPAQQVKKLPIRFDVLYKSFFFFFYRIRFGRDTYIYRQNSPFFSHETPMLYVELS